MESRFVVSSVALALACCAGCGGGDVPETHAVGGIVTLAGTPVEGATVILGPTKGGKPARGVTGPDGRFIVRTYVDPKNDVAGAVPGNYEVVVTKMIDPLAGLSPEERSKRVDEAMSKGERPERRNELPAKYADGATSGLTVVVPADGNDGLEIALEP